MTRTDKSDRIKREREALEMHNAFQHQQAIRSLDRLIRERLATGKPGMIGIRIPFQREKLGRIREIREDEIA